ncbi:TPA: GntR family transcriptional regulator, partial [Streptococcus suis]
LEHFQSIYQRLKIDFNIHMFEEPFVETNEVSFPTPVEIAEGLETDPNQPTILQNKLTTNSASGEIIEYTETYKHWKYYKFEISANNR